MRFELSSCAAVEAVSPSRRSLSMRSRRFKKWFAGVPALNQPQRR
jgi:hypothetical protein